MAFANKELPEFHPALTPSQMLELGIFEGKYFMASTEEYPDDWFTRAKLSVASNVSINFFKVKSCQPLSVWQENGWINDADPNGWLQWFCRFTMGRRIDDDDRQIKRHRAFARHSAQVKKNGNRDTTKRIIQRQALLQWSWDPFPDFPDLEGESVFDKMIRVRKDAR